MFCRFQNIYAEFWKNEFPSPDLETTITETNINAVESKPTIETTQPQQITKASPLNRIDEKSHTETIVNNSNQQKLDTITPIVKENQITSHDHSNAGTVQQSISSKKSMTKNLVYNCFYCDDPRMWNANLNAIYDHWIHTHSHNTVSPFLFYIISDIQKFFSVFNYVTLTDVQLNALRSISNPSQPCHLPFEQAGNIAYLMCSECEMLLAESGYFEHIIMHANELLTAKNDGSDPNIRLKVIHLNTKVVFSNGLLLTKHNLSTTSLDDSKIFDQFISTLLNIKTEVADDAGPSSPVVEIAPPIVSSTTILQSSNRDLTENAKQMQRMNVSSIIGDSRKFDKFINGLKNNTTDKTDSSLSIDKIGSHKVTIPERIKGTKPPNQIQVEKRKLSEQAVERSKKPKVIQQSTSASKPIIHEGRSKLDKDEKVQKKTEKAVSSSTTVSSTTTSHASHDLFMELETQSIFMNSLCIFGVPERGDEILNDIFSKICRELGVSIDFEADVLAIQRVSLILIGVRFNDFKKKEEILNSNRSKSLYLRQVLENVSNKYQKIRFKNRYTPFYRHIEEHLQKALHQGTIHSFALTQNGFEFKRTRNSDAKVILSTQQFDKAMKKKK